VQVNDACQPLKRWCAVSAQLTTRYGVHMYCARAASVYCLPNCPQPLKLLYCNPRAHLPVLYCTCTMLHYLAPPALYRSNLRLYGTVPPGPTIPICGSAQKLSQPHPAWRGPQPHLSSPSVLTVHDGGGRTAYDCTPPGPPTCRPVLQLEVLGLLLQGGEQLQTYSNSTYESRVNRACKEAIAPPRAVQVQTKPTYTYLL
jgi:hypothetical protein